MDGAVFRNNEEKSRFELHADGGTAVAVYERTGSVLAITHTKVPERLEGRGMASQLMDDVVRFARVNDLRILPSCSYAVTYMARHPEAHDVVEIEV